MIILYPDTLVDLFINSNSLEMESLGSLTDRCHYLNDFQLYHEAIKK